MLPQGHPITQEDIDEIRSRYDADDVDIAMIKDIVYHDYWADWEDDGGLWIFRAYDGTYHALEYGHCAMNPEVESRIYDPVEVPDWEALHMIIEFTDEVESNF